MKDTPFPRVRTIEYIEINRVQDKSLVDRGAVGQWQENQKGDDELHSDLEHHMVWFCLVFYAVCTINMSFCQYHAPHILLTLTEFALLESHVGT